jgi:HSP20 family protein
MSLMTRPGRGAGRMMGPAWRRPSMTLWPDQGERWLDRFFDGDAVLEGAMIQVEEYVEDGIFVMKAELPGIDPDRDVEITVTDDQVRLRAERRLEERHESSEGYRSEFRYGSLRRTLPLPVGAQAEEISASYRDGILEVRIPMGAEPTEGRKVPISRE